MLYWRKEESTMGYYITSEEEALEALPGPAMSMTGPAEEPAQRAAG